MAWQAKPWAQAGRDAGAQCADACRPTGSGAAWIGAMALADDPIGRIIASRLGSAGRLR
jgi:hypothetical protein